MSPPASTMLAANDVIVVFGTRDHFSELESLTVATAS
jgi:K+/H+ antiporter YhaU regulatory subunit KhtT